MTEQAQPEPVRVRDVDFSGDFYPEEREFLAAQFSGCRFQLVRRSELDPSLALIYWHGAPSSSGTSPLYAAPQHVPYVLRLAGPLDGPDAPAGGRAQPLLRRIDSQGEFVQRYGAHFPAVRLEFSFWERVRRLFRLGLPVLMAIVFAIWLGLFLWAMGYWP